MKKFEIGMMVVYHGQKLKVTEVFNNGEKATLEGEIIPFMPTVCFDVPINEVTIV